ncbi:MAG TPA: hypothetical protein PKD69_01795, partial [Elusimicrobiota bacterium]|nr:hypothetical protein [Elusimicrobiota bacterium]
QLAGGVTTSHLLHGSANPASRVNRARIPETCGRCHQNVLSVYQVSIHGRASANGIKETPVCTDCHGEHTIQSPENPASSVFRGAVTKTCSGCHESERIVAKFGLPAGRLKSFMDTYHGLASQRGDLRVANCASCHGWHDVLPSPDPQSAVNPANLANTCGRCHAGAQAKLLAGRIHAGKGNRPNRWVLFFRWFYLIAIPLTIGGMLVHNGLDFLRKVIDPPPPPHGRELTVLRLTAHERAQHGLLALAFSVLAYSGFALAFPSAWWAAPFQWAGGEVARKALHRWTAPRTGTDGPASDRARARPARAPGAGLFGAGLQRVRPGVPERLVGGAVPMGRRRGRPEGPAPLDRPGLRVDGGVARRVHDRHRPGTFSPSRRAPPAFARSHGTPPLDAV